jgi:hypothetical protein
VPIEPKDPNSGSDGAVRRPVDATGDPARCDVCTAGVMTKVVICNCYSDHNLGSAALNEAAVLAAKHAFPGCEVTIITAGIKEKFSRDLFRHSLRRHPDVVVLPPPLAPSSSWRGSGLAASLRGELSLRTGRPTIDGPAMDALRGADLALSRAGVVIFDPGSSRRLLGQYLTMFPVLAAAHIGVPTASVPTSIIAPTSRSGAWFERRVLRAIDLSPYATLSQLKRRSRWAFRT